MSVHRQENGTVVLAANCPVEDAEPLLELLQATPTAAVDWTRCSHIHTAVLQIILAARPALLGPCGDLWVQQWMAAEPL
jgi:hypothetical protein